MKKLLLLIVFFLFFLDLNAQRKKMLIVTPEQFYSYFDDFIFYKKQHSIDCYLLKISQNESLYSIKQQIDSFYNQNLFDYLLLIGDGEILPSYAIDEGWSDAPYAFFDSANFPKIPVGRLSIETTEELLLVLEKTKIEHDFLRCGAIASAYPSSLTQEEDFVRLRNFCKKLSQHGFSLQYELFQGNQGSLDGTDSPTSEDLVNVLNSGCEWLFYAGHGSYDGWTTTNFTSSDVDKLKNNVLPIIFSTACLNGNFVGRTCFAEHWLRAGNYNKNQLYGAKAVLMSSILSDWDINLEAMLSLPDSITINSTIGSLWLNAYIYTINYFHRPKEAQTWILFGDPSMPIFAKKDAMQIKKMDKYSIFPNPTNGILNLRLENQQFPIKLTIFNFQGDIIKKYRFHKSDIQIDISNLKNGIYFFQINDKQIYKVKLMK